MGLRGFFSLKVEFLTVKIRFYVINHSMRNMQIININTPR